ncbi:MAG: tRNA pseudouridine(55) synthase TruB [Deltaproteobacteria bacterium]|nr:tRNA pseudouridine(55) synthase TruB [Deltaproteobacteria bacterium]
MLAAISKFIILDKAPGMSSQQAIFKLKKLLKIKKIGHTGTLDPLATGVLPVALNAATKIIPYLAEEKKIYQVRGKLGETTNTYDSEGEILKEADFSGIHRSDMQKALETFLGEVTQRPPIYSAIKVKGRALYHYARKQQEVEVPLRKVFFHQIELNEWDPPFFSLQVECSRGTYIRSLIHDLGLKLGCLAHMVDLRRLQSGIFKLERSLTLEQIEHDSEAVENAALSLEECLQHLDSFELQGEDEWKKIKNGLISYALQDRLQELIQVPQTLRVCYQGEFMGLMSLGELAKVEKLRLL